jgi:cobalt transporter subunit CbtB
MTTTTLSGARASASELVAIAAAACLGLALIWAAGFSHAAAMHDTSHDQRHALAFPCH